MKSGKSVTPSTPAPNNEKLFELPTSNHRNYWKFFLVLVGLIALGTGGYFAYSAYSKPAPAPVVETPQEPEEKIIPEGTRYYLAYNEDDTEARIYRYSENSSEPDEKIASIPQKNLSIIGKYTKPYTYVTHDAVGNKLQLLDATTGKLEQFFDVPKTSIVGQVAVSEDKKFLAYGRTYEGGEKDGYGELWLYNIETKEQKQLGEKIPLKLYQVISVIGWRDNDSKLVVSAVGGDAGAVWGDIYEADTQTGKLTTLTKPEDANLMGFLFGRLSPDANQWLYEFCATPDTEVREKNDGFFEACTSGAELRIYDFVSQQTKTIYQNFRYEDNVDKSALRTFMSYVWQDNKTIIAAVPGALLSIPVSTPDKTTEILSYDRFTPQDFKNDFLNIDSATPGSIVFSRSETWHVFDRVSQKLVNINTFDRKERITVWLN